MLWKKKKGNNVEVNKELQDLIKDMKDNVEFIKEFKEKQKKVVNKEEDEKTKTLEKQANDQKTVKETPDLASSLAKLVKETNSGR